MSPVLPRLNEEPYFDIGLEPVEIDIDDRGHIERDDLRDQQAANNRNT